MHDLLSRLFRAATIAGSPAPGSEAFKRVVASVDVLGVARSAIEEAGERAVDNPRARRDVYNKVARAFQSQYASVSAPAETPAPVPPEAPPEAPGAEEDARGVDRRDLLFRQGLLSEEGVLHPTLPLRGFIDLLVHRDGRTTVLDFKTGAAHAEHREQLLVYALMWWRSTGDLPATIELCYGARVESWDVSVAELERVEQALAVEVARHREGLASRPAAASVGPRCGGCGVRQLCGDYWASLGDVRPSASGGERSDVEVIVENIGTGTGLLGRTRHGQEVEVVFAEDVAAMHGPFGVGERLRILGAYREPGSDAFRLTRVAEVFRPGNDETCGAGAPAGRMRT